MAKINKYVIFGLFDPLLLRFALLLPCYSKQDKTELVLPMQLVFGPAALYQHLCVWHCCSDCCTTRNAGPVLMIPLMKHWEYLLPKVIQAFIISQLPSLVTSGFESSNVMKACWTFLIEASISLSRDIWWQDVATCCFLKSDQIWILVFTPSRHSCLHSSADTQPAPLY